MEEHRNVLNPTIPVSADVIFSNHKGEHKDGIEKRQRKLLGNIQFLTDFLHDTEEVLYIAVGLSPLSILDYMFTGAAVAYLKKAVRSCLYSLRFFWRLRS